jgi:hypothetical protein
MKLHELAVTSPTKQAAKVFESYFGNSVTFEQLSAKQAQHMLNRVRGLIKEHRGQPGFHTSEQNPTYLKLVVMEQGLAGRLRETQVAPVPGTQVAGTMPSSNPQAQAALMSAQQQQAKRTLQDQIKQKEQELSQLKQQLNNPTMMETIARHMGRQLTESEVAQAQVVLASQDMVDQVQKMIEQVTAMQFKDLPALVDQIKNQVGPDQAMQFNQDATGALTSLTQNLQGSKQQLDAALGVVTGQSAVVPGDDMGAPDMGADLGGEIPPVDGEEEIDVDLDADIDLDKEPETTALGREKR